LFKKNRVLNLKKVRYSAKESEAQYLILLC